MAGEGSKYTRRKTVEECRKLLRQYQDSVKEGDLCVPAIISDDRKTATLPDGSIVPITVTGKIAGKYAIVCRAGNQYIAKGDENKKLNPAKQGDIGIVLEKYDTLFVRKLGVKSKRFPIPKVFPDTVPETRYTGGFSSDSNHIAIISFDVQDNGANVLIYWAILHNFDIQAINGVDALTYEKVTSGVYNLNEQFESGVLPQIDPPLYADNFNGGETRGLAGLHRTKTIYHYWVDEYATNPPTPEEIQEFIDFLIEYFELTPEDVALLFGDSSLQAVIHAYRSKPNQLAPIIKQTNEFIVDPQGNLINPDGSSYCGGVGWYPDRVGCSGSTSSYYIGNFEISLGAENIKPVFMEVGFGFNNDENGEPVLDLIASYKTTAVYFKEFERWNAAVGGLSTYSGSYWISQRAEYERANDTAWSYSYDENAVYNYQERVDFLNNYVETITNTEGGNLNWNFHMKNDGEWPTIDSTPSTPSPTYYYSVRWFDDPSCSDAKSDAWPNGTWPGCPAYIPGTEEATSMAAFNFYGGFPSVPIIYPPDYGSKISDIFDYTTFTVIGNATPKPAFFGTSYPYASEPYFHGYYSFQDVEDGWNGGDYACVFQFGRGVMVIKNANSSPTVTYIDRPPGAPDHYDHLERAYLGVNGTRALLVRDSQFGAYAWSPEYIATTNQIVGTKTPDAFTDIYYIDQGTYPFTNSGVKGIDSKKFIQYTSWDDGTEDIIALTIDINPTRVTINGFDGAGRPDYVTPGLVYDYCLKLLSGLDSQ